MKLYYSPGACSLAPHIALREAGRNFDLERVDLPTHRTAGGRDYLEINPKGYVPALELDGPGSELLTESQVILQYIADLAPDAALIPVAGTFARYHAQEWLAFISTELHKQFSPLFNRKTPEATQQYLRGKIADRLLYIGDVLGTQGYLMGEHFTVCDAYLFVMLQWCGKFGIDLSLWPNVSDYETKLSERPAIIAAMKAEGIEGRHRLLESA
jgi:glutathione S-transferase